MTFKVSIPPPETKVALVTGASRGLGRALSLAFSKKKYLLAINFNQSESDAKSLLKEIKNNGGDAALFKADVGNSTQVNSMTASVLEKFGRIDVLVNNAGLVRNKTIAKMTDDEWRDVFRANLDSAFYCTRAIIPIMRNQKGGAILNIVSYIAGRGAVGAANYAAAKAGLVTFTKNTALEESRFHIRANALMPGFHVTEMNKDVWAKYEAEIRKQHLLSQLPERGEMADFAVQLAELTSVTGQVFSFESRIL
jgi:3-oxoacyl-[acyl-carrier protein] reductase